MYRKFIILSLLIAMCVSSGYAQDQRTKETQVADIIMLLPSKSTVEHNRLMGELSQHTDMLPIIASKLVAPGQGDDSKTRYAISGLANYASKDSSNTLKKSVAQGLCISIEQANSDEVRDFLFIQLQFVAGEETVKTVANYLTNDRLCDAAARVLIRINTETANTALLDALKTAKDKQQITLVAALGQITLHPEEPVLKAITALAGSPDTSLQKVVLRSLGQLSSPTSVKVLSSAASKAAYTFEPTDAWGSYVLYLGNLIKDGETELAASEAEQIIKNTSLPKQATAKSAALQLFIAAAGEKAIPQIMNALSSDNKSYRVAALKHSMDLKSATMEVELLKKAKSQKDPVAKAEIIEAFGWRGDKSATTFVIESLENKSPVVVAAAIATASKLDGELAVAPIVKAMSNGNQEVVNAGKNALLRIAGSNVEKEAAAAIPSANATAKVALIDILAQRRATDYSNVVIAQLGSSDLTVRKTAYEALKDLVKEENLIRLAILLEDAPTEHRASVQEAMYNAIKNSGTQEQQTQLILKEMHGAGNKAYSYYNVLAMIGGQTALKKVSEGFENTDATVKAAAFEALTNWSDFSATEALFAICKSNASGQYFDQALKSYVSKINPSKNTNDQKLLLLRRALDIAETNEQKNEIIKQIGNTGVFLGMITASKYLDNTDLQQSAVQAVFSVALKSKRYYGPTVNTILYKAIAVNQHPEANYQKEAIMKYISSQPTTGGYVSIFNGRDLSEWKGLVENPIARAKMTPTELAQKQIEADEIMRRDWKVENGYLVFEGKGYDNLCSEKDYADFDLILDWRITAGGDAGVYLRGTPQVQIWDTALVKVGAQVGSGGLYNNQRHTSKPLVVADNPINEWNTFRIHMVGEKVTVYLNGQLVTDNVTLENYWDRKLPIFPSGAIELQAHGERVEYRNIYVKEIPRPEAYKVSVEEEKEGFVPMFNGIDMSGWVGNLKDYIPKDGAIVCDPSFGGRGNLYTDKEYSDFIMRFDFQLTPAANNGLGIRTPMEGDAAYMGMELQILDNEADVYKDLAPYQFHGSVYGVIAAKRGYLKPVGEWNTQEVIAKGNRITVTLNGTVILDGDIAEASENFTRTLDGKNHPGLSNPKGHIGFLGHGSEVAFRNLRIKELTTIAPPKPAFTAPKPAAVRRR